ncbi:MAG: glycosyltransferase [Solirubrobacteraceae bacterium]
MTGPGLAHDYLLVMRGAERTFAQIARCFPGAPVYTLLYDRERLGRLFSDREVVTSRLQRLPIRQRGFRSLLPLCPGAIDRLAVAQHDVLVSSSSAFAHGVRQAPEATHICYCHSPFRYIWHERDLALREVPSVARPLLARELRRIRRWDLAAAGRVDHFIANSRITQERIATFWGRDSTIIHPPVDVERFQPGIAEDFFLTVGELVPHKRFDQVLLAAEHAGRRVKVVGTGPELGRLRARFGAGAEFLGRVQDDHLADLMARARALVVSTVEEFGIAAVEAQAAGRPVIGPDRGGTRETVRDGETGILYPAHDFDTLAEVMRDVDFDRFDPALARRSAMRFRADLFRRRIRIVVKQLTCPAPPGEPEYAARSAFSDRARTATSTGADSLADHEQPVLD